MINREQFINEIAEVVNRNSMERRLMIPRFVLALVAVEAMEMFTRASAYRDDFHEFRTADYARKHKAICEKKAKPVNTCKGCPLIDVCPAVQMEKQPERKREYKKPEAFDVPKEVEAMAAFFADMFPGSEIQIQRVDLKKNPRDKRRGKNKRNGKRAQYMKPVEFPGVNVVFAKDQPEYMPLPAMKIPNDPQGLIITKWQLSPEELERVKETGTIHLSMLTFNQPLQPVLLTVDLPTEK